LSSSEPDRLAIAYRVLRDRLVRSLVQVVSRWVFEI